MSKMEIMIKDGKKVDAFYKGFTIKTDQPKEEGGENSAPEPFSLFLASIGTCMGYYASAFCKRLKLPTEGMKIEIEFITDEKTHLVGKVAARIKFPENFPEKYKNAVIKSAESCTVKRQMSRMPEFETLPG